MKNSAMLFGGALAGGIIGYFGFFWMAQQGFYALALPGGLLGLGAGIGKSKSIIPAIICCIAALALGLYTEWKFEPFSVDNSFSYFAGHIHHLRPVTMLMIAGGAFVGFWVPFRRVEPRSATAKS
ncbi:MAG TPA: hypothetical protein VHX65_02005 [Pirellulales bacterium]|jgi:hypothetical protein|nr:hypothetical protein [Pirellulales bacterium]